MQFGKLPCIRQADARAGMHVRGVGAVEEVEDGFAVALPDEFPVVGNFDAEGVLVARQAEFDVRFAILDRVGQEVAHDLGDGLGIDPCHDGRVLGHIDEQHTSCRLDGGREAPVELLHELVDVGEARTQCDLAFLHLAEVEQLVHQQEQAVHIEAHHVEVVAHGRFELLLLRQQYIERCLDEGERRAYLMRHVGEEVDLRAVEFAFLLLPIVAHLLQHAFAAACTEEVDARPQQAQQKHGVDAPRPDGLIEGWADDDLEPCLVHLLLVLAVEGCQVQGVVARRQFGVRDAFAARQQVAPVGVEALQPVLQLVGFGGVEAGYHYAQGQRVFVRSQFDAVEVADRAVDHGLVVLRREAVVENPHVGDHGFGQTARAHQLIGVETYHAPDGACIDGAALGDEARTVVELVRRQAVAGRESADFGRRGIDAVEASVGGGPKGAVRILDQLIDHALGQGHRVEAVGDEGLGACVEAAEALLGVDPMGASRVLHCAIDHVAGDGARLVVAVQVLLPVLFTRLAHKEACRIGGGPEGAVAVLEEVIDEGPFQSGRHHEASASHVVFGHARHGAQVDFALSGAYDRKDAVAGQSRTVVAVVAAQLAAGVHVDDVQAVAERSHPQFVADAAEAVDVAEAVAGFHEGHLPRRGVEHVQSLVLGAYPDPSVGVLAYFAHTQTVPIAAVTSGIELLERAVRCVEVVHTAEVRPYPDATVAVGEDAVEGVVRQRIGVLSLVEIVLHLSCGDVEHVEAVLGAHPHVVVLEHDVAHEGAASLLVVAEHLAVLHRAWGDGAQSHLFGGDVEQTVPEGQSRHRAVGHRVAPVGAGVGFQAPQLVVRIEQTSAEGAHPDAVGAEGHAQDASSQLMAVIDQFQASVLRVEAVDALFIDAYPQRARRVALYLADGVGDARFALGDAAQGQQFLGHGVVAPQSHFRTYPDDAVLVLEEGAHEAAMCSVGSEGFAELVAVVDVHAVLRA